MSGNLESVIPERIRIKSNTRIPLVVNIPNLGLDRDGTAGFDEMMNTHFFVSGFEDDNDRPEVWLGTRGNEFPTFNDLIDALNKLGITLAKPIDFSSCEFESDNGTQPLTAHLSFDLEKFRPLAITLKNFYPLHAKRFLEERKNPNTHREHGSVTFRFERSSIYFICTVPKFVCVKVDKSPCANFIDARFGSRSMKGSSSPYWNALQSAKCTLSQQS